MADVPMWEEAHSLAAALTRGRGRRKRKEKAQNIQSSHFLQDKTWVLPQ